MNETLDRYQELWNKIKEYDLKDEYFKKIKQWEKENKIYPDTEAWAFGIFIIFVCTLLFIPFEVSEQFKAIYALLIGIFASIIQHYRLKEFSKKREVGATFIMDKLISEFIENKNVK